jgi:hypothetical protein
MMQIPRDPFAKPPPPPDPEPTDHLPVRFPNARQGDAYEQPFPEPDGAGWVLYRWEAIPASCGLHLDPRRMVVFGTPAESGECKVVAAFRDPTNGQERERVACVYVNADPRSLWKDTPSSPDTPFWKPDVLASRLDGANATLVAARRRGRSHAHVGSCCDDDFHLATVGDWSIAIVADGAGSAKASRLGSHLAVEAAGTFLTQALGGLEGAALTNAGRILADAPSDPAAARNAVMRGLWTTVGAAAHEAMKALDAARATHNVELQDLSTTLLVSIARPVGERWLVGAYWVGDGALAVLSRNPDEVALLGEVDSGEYSGQTVFLDPSQLDAPALGKRLCYALVDHLEAVFLLTDGVSDPRFDSEDKMAQTGEWTALWQELTTLMGDPETEILAHEKLLAWLDFWSPGNHDDRTIALVIPAKQGA